MRVGFQLLWLMYLRFMTLSQLPEEDEAVQVEFIGRGNVAEGGGALATAGAPSAEASAAPARRAPTPALTSGRPDAAAIDAVATPPPAQVVAHTNLYWSFQRAPGRQAAVVSAAEVTF